MKIISGYCLILPLPTLKKLYDSGYEVQLFSLSLISQGQRL